jgi:HK97 gp10 family phage protein
VADSGATVEGVEAASRAYLAVADDARNMSEAHARIAAAAADAARSRAPVRTGALAGTIAAKSTPADAELVVGVPYWAAQEFGTRYVAARRYMRAGIDAGRAAADPAYRARLGAIIEART